MQIRLGQILAAAFLYGAITVLQWQVSLTIDETYKTEFLLAMMVIHGLVVTLGLVVGAKHVRNIPASHRFERGFVFVAGLLTPYFGVIGVIGTLNLLYTALQWELGTATVNLLIVAFVCGIDAESRSMQRKHAPPVKSDP